MIPRLYSVVFAIGITFVVVAPSASRWTWLGEWTPASAALTGIAAFLVLLLDYADRAVALLRGISTQLEQTERGGRP